MPIHECHTPQEEFMVVEIIEKEIENSKKQIVNLKKEHEGLKAALKKQETNQYEIAIVLAQSDFFR